VVVDVVGVWYEDYVDWYVVVYDYCVVVGIVGYFVVVEFEFVVGCFGGFDYVGIVGDGYVFDDWCYFEFEFVVFGDFVGCGED